jgi:hypothetical protein
MRKIGQYRRGMELCLANAVKAPFSALRAVRQTLATATLFPLRPAKPAFSLRIAALPPAMRPAMRADEERAFDAPQCAPQGSV